MEQMTGIGVLAHVQHEHRVIEQMLSAVDTAAGDRRRDAFEDLVRRLVIHETVEELVVHPLLVGSSGEQIRDTVLAQEDTAKHALANFDGLDVDSVEFTTHFHTLRHNVKAHAQFEEAQEHPALAQHEDVEKLERLRAAFEAAEKVAPTRPHPQAPDGRVGILVLGPILALADRVRDAIRDARRSG